MDDNRALKKPVVDRKKRVKRLKKLILITICVLIFVPLALCIYYGCEAHSLKQELARINEELNFYLELQSEAAFAEVVGETADIEEFDSQADAGMVSQSSESAAKKETVSLLNGDVDRLTLSEEELYDGYRKVYLTFDDGPSPNTDRILDILNQYSVKGTFFVVRRDGRNCERMYRRIVDEGHSLGMHSCTHVYRNLYADKESFLSDTTELRNFLYMVTGVESDIYRFPGGSSNKVSKVDMHVFAEALEEEGIVFFDWNVSSQDASGVKQSKDSIVKNVTSRITAYDEVMVLFHDLDSKDSTVEALPEIIEYIQSLENTVILPVTRDTVPVRHLNINN